MADESPNRSVSIALLLVTAAAGGAFAGLVGGAFIWLVESLIHVFWHDLPDALGVDPFGSWWLFALPVAGGVLVGLGQRFLGNYPEAIEEVVGKWRTGGRVEPSKVPAIAVNSLSAMVMGGPVGFEAALTGLLGGIATWVGERISAARDVVRQAWGSERVEGLPKAVADLPYWLAGVSGLVVYKALPFGGIGMGFRFGDISNPAGSGNLLAVAALAALLAVPLVWSLRAVRWAETSTYFARSPVIVAVAGGVVFATMAINHEYVLFSGQEIYQQLPQLATGGLVYLVVAKWAALVVALLAGWRGGPVFPMITSASSAAVLVGLVVDVPVELLMVAAVASVSTVFVKGKVPLGFLVSLYVVPLSNAGLILIGCVGAAVSLGLMGAFGLVPEDADLPAKDSTPTTDPPRSRGSGPSTAGA